MLDPVIILAALVCGMAARAVGLPALIGYLGAGFLLYEFDIRGGEILHTLSDVGITLLLFTIGLKLQPLELLRAQIWGTTLSHMALMQILFMAVLSAAALLTPALAPGLSTVALVAFALTFSSTVFVIQILQERGETASRHARLAVGILVMQDIVAVIFLAVSLGKLPDPGAVLLLGLWPLRRVLLRLLSHCGHGELFTLFGLTLAVGGAQLFEHFSIKGDLGALIIGAILAGDQKAKELSRNLLQFKDLFLVGFFLSIGLSGWPDREIALLSIILGLLCVVKPLLYFPIMSRLHTQPRTALLTSVALTNHSEFGLIVIAVAANSGWIDSQWSAAISLAIAVSFIIASPLNSHSHKIYRRWQNHMRRFETEVVKKNYPDTRDATIFILGMGNIGTGAYEWVAQQYGWSVVGVDDNALKLARHRREHRRVVAADASDPEFWKRVDLNRVQLIMLALTNHQENMLVARLLKEFGYEGRLAAVVRFAEEADELTQHGVSAFNLYDQAGRGFASHATAQLENPETSHMRNSPNNKESRVA